MPADSPSPTQKPGRGCQTFRTRSLRVHLAGYGLGAVVVTATFLLYGVVLGLQVLLGGARLAGPRGDAVDSRDARGCRVHLVREPSVAGRGFGVIK